MGTSISFDRIADRYDETRGGMDRARRFAPTIAEHLRDGPVLEIGVGTGAVAAALGEHGHTVVGMDLSPGMLAHAAARLGSRVSVADAVALPVPDASISSVLACWVLHLVGDPVAVLGELARVLRPGGRLVVVHGRPRWEEDDLLPHHRQLFDLRPTRPAEILVHGVDDLDIVARTETALSPFEESPAELASAIEGRTWSSLWDLDDRTWSEVVEPVIEGLRSLPDQHRPRRRANAHPVLVLERS